jgi:hypothetical protein
MLCARCRKMNRPASPRLTHVTASASASGSGNHGIWNFSGSSPTMTDVTVAASGASSNTGVHNSQSSPTMTDVEITASGGGNGNIAVFNEGTSNPTMTSVTATASGPTTENYGMNLQQGGSPTITHSKFSGGRFSLFLAGGDSSTVKVALTELDGPILKANGTLQCFSNYDRNLNPVTCPS